MVAQCFPRSDLCPLVEQHLSQTRCPGRSCRGRVCHAGYMLLGIPAEGPWKREVELQCRPDRLSQARRCGEAELSNGGTTATDRQWAWDPRGRCPLRRGSSFQNELTAFLVTEAMHSFLNGGPRCCIHASILILSMLLTV